MLHRLIEDQAVVLDLGEEVINCRVVGVHGEDVVLAPLSVADAGYIPSLGRTGVLAFEAQDGHMRLEGAVRPGERAGSLLFTADVGAGLPPRRRALRIDATLAIELVPLAEHGASAGRAMRLRTADVSLCGLGVRVGEPSLRTGALLGFTLELPGPSAISGTARVLRTDGDIAGLDLVRITPGDRARLAAFLLAGQAAG
ncbi:MAG: PilZ domain-containing protein [Solirubrobacterales bacterium]|nr:PilZ domain-containing protein [Solirubrobacterales bacterium]